MSASHKDSLWHWLAKHKLLFAVITALVYIVSGFLALWLADMWDIWWALVGVLAWAYASGMIVFVLAFRRYGKNSSKPQR